MSNYNAEIEFLNKWILKTERALEFAKQKNNVQKSEIDNLENKLDILSRIKDKIEE